jgi:hypothetical protein
LIGEILGDAGILGLKAASAPEKQGAVEGKERDQNGRRNLRPICNQTATIGSRRLQPATAQARRLCHRLIANRYEAVVEEKADVVNPIFQPGDAFEAQEVVRSILSC